MRVIVETYGRRDFCELRDELIGLGRKFDETSLRVLPYSQLYLCCIGNAGVAICDPALVRREKQARRERFLSTEPEESIACERLLRNEGMRDDVISAVATLGTPRWDDLNHRQKVWAKLNCIFNHIDDPIVRLEEAIGLLGRAAMHDMPPQIAAHYMGRLKALRPRVVDEAFRSQIEEIRDNIRDFLPEPERSICSTEAIRDFHCTSDCFRVIA